MTGRSEVQETATAAIRTWTSAGTSGIEARHSLTRHLQSELAAAGKQQAATQVESLPASEFCDIRIGTDVGIKLYSEFTTVTARQLRLLAWRDELPYEYLVLLGHDLSAKHRDTWRIVETRIGTASNPPGVQSIKFALSTDRGTATPGGNGWTIWYYAEPVTALLLLLVGTTVVVLLQLDFGNANTVVAAIVTVLVSLVLVSVLGLLSGDAA